MAGQWRLSIAVAIGTTSIAGLVIWWKYQQNKIPTKWRQVGELSELVWFPIKSGGPIYSTDMECTVLGLQKGHLSDRTLMVTTPDGKFVTGRMFPKLVLICPSLNGGILTLAAPEMEDIDLDIEKLSLITPSKASVWNQEVDIIDCGAEVAVWFSKYLLNEPTGLKLVYYPLKYSQRPVQQNLRCYKELSQTDGGALHDNTSYNVLNQSSLDDLNSRIKESSVSALQFRPNFIVKGAMPYEEDDWRWIKIGEVVFRVLKPSDRCIFTTINPETGVRDKSNEPIRTLRKYRLMPQFGQSPVLGTNLGIRVPGTVELGNMVYVNA